MAKKTKKGIHVTEAMTDRYFEYLDILEQEQERNDIITELCGKWNCSPDEISQEEIDREQRRRLREICRM